MDCPRLLRGSRGILWKNAGQDVCVLWAYRDFDWRVGEKAQVYDVMAAGAAQVHKAVFKAKGNCVYLVQDAPDP